MIEFGTCLFLSFTAHKSVSMVFISHFFSHFFFFGHHLSSVYTLYLLGFLFLAGVYECLVCLYITHSLCVAWFRLCMICDYIFPYIFFILSHPPLFFFYNSFLVLLRIDFLLGYSGTK